MSSPVDVYSGVVFYSEKGNPVSHYEIRNSGMIHMMNVQETNLPYVYIISIRGNDREKLIRKLEELGTILSRIEYGGYVVTKTYETTEYKGDIIGGKKDV